MPASDRRTIAVVTGTRADYGLLRPVMAAIDGRADLTLAVVVTGTHLLEPTMTPRRETALSGAHVDTVRPFDGMRADDGSVASAATLHEVAAEFDIAAMVPMQRQGATGRSADATALGRGMTGLTQALHNTQADVVLVLGDRIEAFAAAAAASVMGVRVAHMHGGDRAEGIADEAMRHAITKLAHIHLPATEQSARRIIAMGEHERTVHMVGSPAIDGLDQIPALDDAFYRELGEPALVFLLHPIGRDDESERRPAAEVLAACAGTTSTLALHPNFDPGREGIVRAIEESGVPSVAHLPRERFIGLLRRVRAIVGNSSAGLIECAALGVRCVNIGPRQAGRERAANVIDVDDVDSAGLTDAIGNCLASGPFPGPHPFGDGRCGEKTAELLATFDEADHPLRKRNTY